MPNTALNELVKTLCSEMAQALDLTSVGMDDNFFELGGHSFLALRFLSNVETQLGRKVDLRSWLRQPTITTLVRLTRPDAVQKHNTS